MALYTCDLNNGGAGGAARLTITPSVAPGNATTRVQYYVAEFDAGVSVQRGIDDASTARALTPTAAPTLTAVDCTKSFVLTSVRSVTEHHQSRRAAGTSAPPSAPPPRPARPAPRPASS